MSDTERDPEAELRALAEAAGEAFRPLAEFARVVVDAFSRAAQAWLDQMRPAFEALERLGGDPQFRAYLEARKLGKIPEPRPCRCFCGHTHPADQGVCETFSAVTTRRYSSALAGAVDVPLCAPCAAAQGIAEPEGAH